MIEREEFLAAALAAGCPEEQVRTSFGPMSFSSRANSRHRRRRGSATVPTGRRPSATAGLAEAAKAIGSSRRWVPTIVSECRD